MYSKILMDIMDYFSSMNVHPFKYPYGHMERTHGFVLYQVCECWTTEIFIQSLLEIKINKSPEQQANGLGSNRW